MNQNDIVTDILDRIAAHLDGGGGLSDADRLELDASVRADWGGERCYIAKTGESTAILMIRRDIAIRQAFRAGNSLGVIARRFGVSRARAQQVVANSPRPTLTDGSTAPV